MSPQSFVRTKPHLNIGTLGHLGHGKTTLTAAITKVLSERGSGRYVPVDRIDRSPEERVRGITIHPAQLEYETGTRHYAHTDLPGHADLISDMVAGAARLDGAILVVSAADGIMPQTAEHMLLARQAGVDHIVVALSKADTGDREHCGQVEREVRELLSAHGYPGPTTPLVHVSGVRALDGDPRWTGAVEALLDAVDTFVPTPTRSLHGPFLLAVDGVTHTAGRGTAVTGVVERGTVRPGDRLDLLGGATGQPVRTTVGEVGMSGRPMEFAQAGDPVALLLEAVPPSAVRRGQVAVAAGSAVAHRRFTARVSLGSAGEGGPHRLASPGRRMRFHIRTADVPGAVHLGHRRTARPGGGVTVPVELDHGLPLEPGLGFAMRQGGVTVGVGTVLTVTED